MPSNKKIQITDAGGNNLLPHTSLDNLQVSKTDNTGLTLATTVDATGSTAAIPTERAVRLALDEKQDNFAADENVSTEASNGVSLEVSSAGVLSVHADKASASGFGTVKVGTNLTVSDGVISIPDASTAAKGVVRFDTAASNGVALTLNGGTAGVHADKASASGFGTVKIGTNITVADGVISIPDASTAAKGVVKIDTTASNGIALTLNGCTAGVSVAKTSASGFGTVKVGTNITVDDGVISVPDASTSEKGVVRFDTAASNGVALTLNGGTAGVHADNASASGFGTVKIGTNITVADGVISIPDASTSEKGVVKIDTTASNGVALTLNGGTAGVSVAKTSASGFGTVKVGTNITVDDGVISVPDASTSEKGVVRIGSGLKIGTGDDAGEIVIDDASVETTLQDVRIDGGSTVSPAADQVLTPANLRGALSVGQAVDVSCGPWYSGSGEQESDFIGGFTVSMSNGSTVGFYGAKTFPKFASGLKYLLVADISGTGTVTPYGGSSTVLGETAQRISIVATEADTMYLTADAASTLIAANWRQYEVTALTDEAIAYIAQLPDPDAFFRAASVKNLRDRYLVKQDMVCPFIPTISMPDNSNLTVAAGLSYKIKYTNDNPHIITADTIPVDGYGWDTHVQLFIKGTSSVVFQHPLILMDALTPNAGHNLVVKFRNGDALVYVEDTNAGNIVVAATGTTAGTLNYFLQQNPGSGQDNYIIFAPSTDGSTCDAGTVTVAYNTDILGNGADKTTITGSYTVAGGKTMNLQDLSISGSTISSSSTGTTRFNAGTELNNVTIATRYCYLDGCYIPENSTVVATVYRLDGMWNIVLDGTLQLPQVTTVFGSASYSFISPAKTGIIDLTGTTLNTGVFDSSQGGSFTIQGLTIYGLNNDNSENSSRIVVNTRGTVTLTDCVIRGNTCGMGVILAETNAGTLGVLPEVYITGCTFADNKGRYGFSGVSTNARSLSYGTPYVYIKDSVFGESQACRHRAGTICIEGGTYCTSVTNTSATVAGTEIHLIAGSTIYFSATDVTVREKRGNFDGMYDPSGGADCIISITIGTMSASKQWTDGGLITIVRGDNITSYLSACRFNRFWYDGTVQSMDTIVVTAPVDIWIASNVTFASPLNASVAGTIKLTGTTFTGAAKTLNANRIQLPAATTVSLSGNTNAADTKILEASVIVVGDNAASPSGSATVVNAGGTASTVSGIGSYIDKEGDNDFVPLTSVSTVSTSATSDAGSLPVALTGDNKFVRLGDGTVGTVGAATDAVNKTVMTNDYEPIIGGTFSLTSATVDEATKTVAIQPGGTMSIVDVTGGKDSVIALNNTAIPKISLGMIAHASGCTFAGGSRNRGGVSWVLGGGSASFIRCTFSGNSATDPNGGGALTEQNGGILLVSSCTFIGNKTGNNVANAILQNNWGSMTIADCTFAPGQGISIWGSNYSSRSFVLCGSNKIDTISAITGGTATVTISSGSILDLTGNTNATPIAPGGGIVVSGTATIINSAGVPSTVTAGTYSTINNDGTVE